MPRVTVGTTATALIAISGSQGSGGRRRCLFTNRGAVSVDVEPTNTVTAGAGYELLAGQSLSADIPDGDTLYGIVASGTCRVDVLSVGP